jgi:WD40 repeat protein
LVNAVLAYPPEIPTAQRIGKALGLVGHLSLAAAAQNMVLLGLLSRVVSPGVAAFCTFAAVAIVLDFVFHLTFFTAVLSVDVRRVELQDSLDRINHAKGNAKSAKPERRTNKLWAVFWSKLPFSTRIAGTAVMICFILVLNTHLYDGDGQTRFPFRMLRLRRPAGASHSASDSFLSPPIHQARTPAAWLKMQDHDTAKELIQFVKPLSHSFVARVYEPVTVVLKGSDRGSNDDPYISFFNALRELAGKHFFPFALVIVFSIAIVTLLMNYLLWMDLPDDDETFNDHTEESLLSIRTLSNAHSLDVVKINGTTKGHLVTVSIDRSTVIWLANLQTKAFSSITLRTSDTSPHLWPIVSAALDDGANALAICTDAGTVAFWDINEGRFKYMTSVDLHGHTPSLFAFTRFHVQGTDMLSLIVVTPHGLLYQLGFHSAKISTYWINHDQILSTAILVNKEKTQVFAAFNDGQIRTVMLSEKSLPESQETVLAAPSSTAPLSRVCFMHPVQALGLVALVRTGQVDLVDIHSRITVHSLQIGPAKAASLRVLHSPRRLCQCKTPGVSTLSIVYTNADTQDCIMQTYSTKGANAVICLRPKSERGANCIGLESATETERCLEQPGAWEATSAEVIIGVRKRASNSAQLPSPVSDARSHVTSLDSREPQQDAENVSTYIKHRTPKQHAPIRTRSDTVTTHRPTNSSDSDFDNWDAWLLSIDGELYARPLFKSTLANAQGYLQNGHALEASVHDEGDQPPLFVTKPGPIARLGKRTIAVALGNTVKIITYAEARMFEDDPEEFHDPLYASIARRRRAGAKKAQ